MGLNQMRSMRFVLATMMVAVMALLTGCASWLPSERQIRAERAMYELLAEPHKRYVAEDPTLSEQEKRHTNLAIETWRIRIESAERRE